jgi:hypothetical protein
MAGMRSAQAAVEIDDGPGTVVDQFVELTAMGSVGALDVGVQLRRVGWEEVPSETTALSLHG